MDKIAILNDSRMARVIYEAINAILERNKKDLLNRLLSETKSGPVDPQVYAKYLGGISALDELNVFLKKEIYRGEKIERELLDANRN
jgi:uncharacterized phage-associated protein